MIGERQRCSYIWNRNTNNKNNHIYKSNERSVPYAFFIETAGALFLSLRHDMMITVGKTIVWVAHGRILLKKTGSEQCVNDNLSTYQTQKQHINQVNFIEWIEKRTVHVQCRYNMFVCATVHNLCGQQDGGVIAKHSFCKSWFLMQFYYLIMCSKIINFMLTCTYLYMYALSIIYFHTSCELNV